MIQNKTKALELELQRMKEKYYNVKNNLMNQVESSEALAKQIIMSQRGNEDYKDMEKIVQKLGDSLLFQYITTLTTYRDMKSIEHCIFDLLSKIDFDATKLKSIIRNIGNILRV